MLAVFHIQIRELLEAYHFVVVHAFSVITGPVGIVCDLGVGNPAAGIFGDTECLVEAVDAHGILSAALGMGFIRAESVFAHIAGCGEDLFPASVFVSFMHGDSRGRQIRAHAGHNKELLHVLILCLGELCDPFGRICFLLDVSMEAGIFRAAACQCHDTDRQRDQNSGKFFHFVPSFPDEDLFWDFAPSISMASLFFRIYGKRPVPVVGHLPDSDPESGHINIRLHHKEGLKNFGFTLAS